MSVNCANDTADRKCVPKEERCDGITSNENITTSTSPLLLPSIVVVVFSAATAAAAGAGGRCYIVQLARARLHSSLHHRLAHQPNSSTAQHGGRRAMLLPQ